MTPPSTTTMRDSGYVISPQWWRAYWGARYAYSMWIMYDAMLDAGGYAVLAGLPSKAPSDAFQWIALDRQIFQGPSETNSSYVARLQQWLDLWRHAGTSTGILLALRSYVAPLTPKMLTVQSAGDGSLSSWDTYVKGEAPFPPTLTNPTSPDHYVSAPANWRWDGLSQPYYYPGTRWRKWVVIFQPASDTQTQWAAPTATWAPASGSVVVSVIADAVYGSRYIGSGSSVTAPTEFNWDDGTNWDWTGTTQDAASLQRLCIQWKSAGCWIPWIIVAYDGTMFDQTLAFGSAKLPDSTWGYWGKVASDATYGTVYVAARPASSVCSLLTGTNDGENDQPLGLG